MFGRAGGRVTNRSFARSGRNNLPAIVSSGAIDETHSVSVRAPRTNNKKRKRRARRFEPWCSVRTLLVGVVLVVSFGSVLIVSWWYGPQGYTRNGLATATKGPNSIAVFYHIFIPSNKGKKGIQKAQLMVQEQIHQVGRAAQSSGKKWTLHYTTTGDKDQNYITHPWIEQTACRKYARHLECVANGPHLEVGYEDVTLHALYEHCKLPPALHGEDVSDPQMPQHLRLVDALDEPKSRTEQKQNDPSTRMQAKGKQHSRHLDNRIVIYLHSKGTYHSNFGRNEIWRQALTYAATHSSCLKSLLTKHGHLGDGNNITSGCNVCGLQFYPVWDNMFLGNMHASRCTYVQQLLEPQHEFPQALERVVKDVNSSSTDRWTRSLYNFNNPGNVGLDRYASEHWIASHPTVRPCDMEGNNATVFFSRVQESQTGEKVDAHAFTKYLSPSKAVARRSPRLAINEGDWFRLQKDLLPGLEVLGTKPPFEYFLLPGLLYRHYRNYGFYPPLESWIWSWYPSGRLWRDKIYNDTTEGAGKVDW